jgi:portal protein
MPRLARQTCNNIRDDIRKWDDYWRFNIDQYHEVTQFVMGDQWREDEARVFETYKKIPLTFNKLAPLLNHLLGEQRQNTPALQVNPSESVPEQTAEVRTALIKDISLNSEAKIVYQGAFEQATIGGFGAFLILNDYENCVDFNQEIRIKGVKDPTRCFWDISAEDICKVDGMYSGTRTRVSRKKFREMYGKDLERSIGSEGNDETTQGFWDDDQITVIDYFSRKYDKVKLCQLSNGIVIESKDIDQLQKLEIEGNEVLLWEGDPVLIEQERTAYRYKVKHKKIAGDYILESSDVPCQSLPLVFVDQHSFYDKHGKQICRPIVKDARDSQRLINFLGTQGAYLIKIARNDQFLVSKENVRSPDTRQIWTDPSVVQGGLVYDESPAGNKPEQLRPPEISASLMAMYERAERDIHTCLGMYDTQLGDQGNEVSKVAIDARTKRGSYNNFITFDALNRAIACAGQIIDEMIPKVYDSERQMMLYMPDSGMQKVNINSPQDMYGMNVENNMTEGRFKIRLLPGPSYEGQKMEGLEALQLVLKNDPSLFKLVADMYAENLPLANSLEIRNRLKTIVPPEIIEAGKTGKPIQKPQQPSPEQMDMQQKREQMMIMAQMKEKELVLKEKELIRKTQEMNQQMMAEMERLQTERMEAAALLQEQEMRYAAELNKTSADLNIAHANNLIKLLTHNPKHTQGEKE